MIWIPSILNKLPMCSNMQIISLNIQTKKVYLPEMDSFGKVAIDATFQKFDKKNI